MKRRHKYALHSLIYVIDGMLEMLEELVGSLKVGTGDIGEVTEVRMSLSDARQQLIRLTDDADLD